MPVPGTLKKTVIDDQGLDEDVLQFHGKNSIIAAEAEKLSI